MSGPRIAFYGSGRTATELMLGLRQVPHELVAAVVNSPHRAGQDFGALTTGEPVGVAATADLEQVLRSQGVDVLLYTGLVGETHEAVTELCVDTGVNQVHACFVHPSVVFAPERLADLETRAARSGARVVGTGLIPGLWVDTLPSLLASAMPGPVRISARRISDLSTWGKDVLAHELGIGGTEVGTAVRYDAALRESARVIADAMRLEAPHVESRGGSLLAEADVQVRNVDVRRGEVEGFDQRVVVTDGGLLRIELSWIGLPDPAARGRPSRVDVTVQGGDGTELAVEMVPPLDPYPGTAARMLSAMGLVRSLAPGFHLPTALPVA